MGSPTADVYKTSFNDIKDNSQTDVFNCATDPNTGNCICTDDTTAAAFYAGPGYDVATGLGTPKLGLINQLAALSPSPPKDVAVGSDHACALRSNGAVWCWGANQYGQLGNGLIDSIIPCPDDAGSCDINLIANLPVPVVELPSQAIAISAGPGSSCAVLSGGVWCWGAGYGAHPVQVSNTVNTSAVAVGAFATCALGSDGTVSCWGDNRTGQLGNGSLTSTVAPASAPVSVTGITDAIAVRSGPRAESTCALQFGGGVLCWGDNFAGQLGNGGQTGMIDGVAANSLVPVPVIGLTDAAVNIAVGGLHACAVLASGSAACWGSNTWGMLGNGTTVDSSTAVAVVGLTNVQEIAAGGGTTCAVLSDGTATCWGLNTFFQLGDGNTDPTENRLQPNLNNPVSGLKGVQFQGPITLGEHLPFQYFSGGNDFYCAVVNNGVYCWGHDIAGSLGDGAKIDQTLATAVQFIHP